MWTLELGFDPSRPSGESNTSERINYPKVSGSILWFSKDKYKDVNGYIGVSAFGLNKVSGSFYNESDSFYDRTVIITGGVRLVESHNLAISPKFYHSSFNGNYSLRIGSDFNYSLSTYGFGTERRNNSLNMELNYVLDRGFQFGIQLLRPNYIAGFGYNLDLYQEYSQLDFNSAFEFLLIIRKPVERSRKARRERRPEQSLNVVQQSTSKLQSAPQDNEGQNPSVIEEIKEIQQSTEPENQIDTVRFKQNVEENYEWESIVTLGEFTGIGFEFNSVEIGESARRVLVQLVDLVNSDVNNKLILIGHADAIGSKSINDRISWERANSVANILVGMGIQEGQIIIQAKGEDQPIATNDTELGRAANRRVEFFIVKTK